MMMRVILMCVCVMLGLLGAEVHAAGAFEGKAYDLSSLSPDRYNTSAALVDKVRMFMEENWDEALLREYKCSPMPINTSLLWVPRCYSRFLIRLFGFSTPSCTACMVVYRGYVEAPESGMFRFVGSGDDVLAVRFNGKTVLEAGYQIPSSGVRNFGSSDEHKATFNQRKNKRALYGYPETPFWNMHLGGVATGNVFKVAAGKVYPMEILLLVSGTESGACLLLEKIESKKNMRYGRLSAGESPVLPLFRTSDAPFDKDKCIKMMSYNCVRKPNVEGVPFLSNGPVWNVSSTPPAKDAKKKGKSLRKNRFRRI